jgi:hypothetical protein
MGKTEREAASLLRRLLAEVDAGRLTAEGRAGKRFRHRVEGAIAALDPKKRG